MKRFAENIVHFVRLLRATGIPVGPNRTLDALAAAAAVGVARKDDFRAALSAVLISRQEHQPMFDQAFEVFWRNPRMLEKMMAALLPKAAGRFEPQAASVPARIAEALLAPALGRRPRTEPNDVEFDAALTFSPRDVLRQRDFETMSVEELAAVRGMLARVRLPLPELPTRRTRPAARGQRIDLRATMRRATGNAGALAPLERRERRRRRPSLVVLCDISGSMERYSRMLMHFLHAITNDRDRAHVFLFGTRLTNVTRQLRHRDVDVALARVGTAASDWAGGTRIGSCLREFNRRWSRRVLAQNAVVLLISDGLDAESGAGLAAEMERLSRSCRRVMWLNPLLRFDRFEPRPAGVRAMLPYVDDFLPCHNMDSLLQLAAAFDNARPSWN
ncbi:MAG: VWA domain-containing protein [Gemmatimonadota bacterium]